MVAHTHSSTGPAPPTMRVLAVGVEKALKLKRAVGGHVAHLCDTKLTSRACTRRPSRARWWPSTLRFLGGFSRALVDSECCLCSNGVFRPHGACRHGDRRTVQGKHAIYSQHPLERGLDCELSCSIVATAQHARRPNNASVVQTREIRDTRKLGVCLACFSHVFSLPLTPRGLQEIFHLFHLYDVDGNGMFDIKELKNLLTTFCNRTAPDHEVEVVMKKLDKNQNGLISWDEFVEGLRTASGEPPWPSQFASPDRSPPLPQPSVQPTHRNRHACLPTSTRNLHAQKARVASWCFH